MRKQVEVEFDQGKLTVTGQVASDAQTPMFGPEDSFVAMAEVTVKDGVLHFSLVADTVVDEEAPPAAAEESVDLSEMTKAGLVVYAKDKLGLELDEKKTKAEMIQAIFEASPQPV